MTTILRTMMVTVCGFAAVMLWPVVAQAQEQAQEQAPAQAQDQSAATPPRYVVPSVEELAIPQASLTTTADPDTRESICLMIESAARANGLPLEFFARVIWQESRFEANAVGPMTRYGSRAQGIAQFMPGTAAERGLFDPFNPVQALPKAAEFLAELRNQFGNLGLAAAAYNAGPRRVTEWLAGTGGMPYETRNYVSVITGSPIEDWAKAGKGGKMPESAPPTTCRDLMALLKRAPNSFVAGLEEHVKLAAAKVWGVQLAAGFDRNKALAMYNRAVKNLSEVIGGRDPSILRSTQRSRGAHAFYQVRIGADTRPEADDLCNRIRKAGGACFVLRNFFLRG